MAVFANVDNIQWFFRCKKCKPDKISDNYPTQSEAERMEQLHIRLKHSK